MSVSVAEAPVAALERVFLAAIKSSQTYNGHRFTLYPSVPQRRYVELFPIVFDRESGLSTLRVGNGEVKMNSLLLQNGEELSEILRLHASINRILTFNPYAAGLHVSKGPAEFRPWRTENALGFFSDGLASHSYWASDIENVVSREFIRLVPKELRGLGYRWHASMDAPKEFGTPCLVPSLHIDSDSNEESEGWVLRLLGMEQHEPLAKARWNDFDGISRLVEQVKSMSPEAALSFAAITADRDEQSDIRSLRMRHDQIQMRPLAAEEWNASMAIRPILVTRAIKAAEREIENQGARRVHPDRIWFTSLRTSAVFSSQNCGPQDKEVAKQGFVRNRNSAQAQEFASVLQRHLDERDLGVAVLAKDHRNQTTVLVVKNIEFMRKYHPLFGIPDVESIQPVTPDPSA